MSRKEMYGAVWCPGLPLQALLWRRPELAGEILGVVDDECLCVVSPEAEEATVHLGMTPVQAQARCPEMVLVVRDIAAEDILQARLVRLAGTLTPEVEATGLGAMTLGLAGVSRGWEEFVEEVEARLVDAKLIGFVAVAEGADLAMLAAKAREGEPEKPSIVPGGVSGAREYVWDLPVARAGEVGEVLALWGISTLGELAELPVEGLVERLGEEALALWQVASGYGNRRVLRLVRDAAVYVDKIDLECGVETLEPLLFQGQRMLEGLGAQLSAHGQAAGDLTVTLGFELSLDVERKFRIPEPSAIGDKLFPILQSGLEALAEELLKVKSSRDGVVSFQLELTAVAASGCQLDFLRRTLTDPNAFMRTLGRVNQLLGKNRTGTPLAGERHQPDTFTLVSDRVNPGIGIDVDLVLRAGLPLRRFRPAAEIRVAASVEDGGVELPQRAGSDAVVSAQGPWLGSGEWWQRDRSWARAEWDVLLEGDRTNGLFRLAQEDGRWVVDGVYAQW